MAAYQRASVRVSLLYLSEAVNGTYQNNNCPMSSRRQTCMEELNLCGTPRPRRPEENSVYQYLSIIV